MGPIDFILLGVVAVLLVGALLAAKKHFGGKGGCCGGCQGCNGSCGCGHKHQ